VVTGPPSGAVPGPSIGDDDPMARTILAPPPAKTRSGEGPAKPDAEKARSPRAASATATPMSRTSFTNSPTIELDTRKLDGWEPPPESEAKPKGIAAVRAGVSAFFKRHETLLWWAHTAYALGLGLFVATFAQKGFERARWLAVSLALAWILVALFFRFFGTGARQDFLTAWPGARRRFFVMTYLMKNLFQGMLFFLLPFYWRAASLDAGTAAPLVLVACCAVVSTLDLVVDRFLFRWKVMASAFYSVTLFGAMQVVIPAIVPGVHTLTTLATSGGLAMAALLLFHLPLTTLKRPVVLGIFLAMVAGGAAGAYALRSAIPAVPMFVREGGAGPERGPDGALAVEVRSFRASHVGAPQFPGIWAVTDVAVVGAAEPLVHVWKHKGKAILGAAPTAATLPEKTTVRVASHLPKGALPADPTGRWTIDVQTESGQIVGRVAFDVRP
jgi:hypothetical protein